MGGAFELVLLWKGRTEWCFLCYTGWVELGWAGLVGSGWVFWSKCYGYGYGYDTPGDGSKAFS